jgi:hypothetical protein
MDLGKIDITAVWSFRGPGGEVGSLAAFVWRHFRAIPSLIHICVFGDSPLPAGRNGTRKMGDIFAARWRVFGEDANVPLQSRRRQK